MRVVLRLGFKAPPLSEQLRRSDADVESWQELSDAITRLQLEGLISWAASRGARRKLAERIEAGITSRKVA